MKSELQTKTREREIGNNERIQQSHNFEYDCVIHSQLGTPLIPYIFTNKRYNPHFQNIWKHNFS